MSSACLWPPAPGLRVFFLSPDSGLPSCLWPPAFLLLPPCIWPASGLRHNLRPPPPSPCLRPPDSGHLLPSTSSSSASALLSLLSASPSGLHLCYRPTASSLFPPPLASACGPRLRLQTMVTASSSNRRFRPRLPASDSGLLFRPPPTAPSFLRLLLPRPRPGAPASVLLPVHPVGGSGLCGRPVSPACASNLCVWPYASVHRFRPPPSSSGLCLPPPVSASVLRLLPAFPRLHPASHLSFRCSCRAIPACGPDFLSAHLPASFCWRRSLVRAGSRELPTSCLPLPPSQSPNFCGSLTSI